MCIGSHNVSKSVIVYQISLCKAGYVRLKGLKLHTSVGKSIDCKRHILKNQSGFYELISDYVNEDHLESGN